MCFMIYQIQALLKKERNVELGENQTDNEVQYRQVHAFIFDYFN